MNKQELAQRFVNDPFTGQINNKNGLACAEICIEEVEKELKLTAGRTVGIDELEYWKKRCEAAEEVIKVMDVPKNKSGMQTLGELESNMQFKLFGERNHKWQQLKTSKS